MQNIKKKEDLLVCDIFFIEIMTLCQSISLVTGNWGIGAFHGV